MPTPNLNVSEGTNKAVVPIHSMISSSSSILKDYVNIGDVDLSQKRFKGTEVGNNTDPIPKFHLKNNGNILDCGYQEIFSYDSPIRSTSSTTSSNASTNTTPLAIPGSNGTSSSDNGTDTPTWVLTQSPCRSDKLCIVHTNTHEHIDSVGTHLTLTSSQSHLTPMTLPPFPQIRSTNMPVVKSDTDTVTNTTDTAITTDIIDSGDSSIQVTSRSQPPVPSKLPLTTVSDAGNGIDIDIDIDIGSDFDYDLKFNDRSVNKTNTATSATIEASAVETQTAT